MSCKDQFGNDCSLVAPGPRTRMNPACNRVISIDFDIVNVNIASSSKGKKGSKNDVILESVSDLFSPFGVQPECVPVENSIELMTELPAGATFSNSVTFEVDICGCPVFGYGGTLPRYIFVGESRYFEGLSFISFQMFDSSVTNIALPIFFPFASNLY